MRGLRRAAVAVALGGMVALVLRLRGGGGTPPTGGGWSELDPNALDAP